jgi:alkylation response protein AidB-like acyl-CoA dehydrogenase
MVNASAVCAETGAEAAARDRVAELEAVLGDPTDPGNPLGYRPLLAADRAAVPFAAAEAALADREVNAEYVPRRLGGRLESMETLVRVMRPLFRRDIGLGMGFGMHTFMAAADVWLVGDEQQQRWLAGRMLDGARAAISQPETAHSNDYVRSEVQSRRSGAGFRLSGSKPMINNLGRSAALVLFCRTIPATPGHRSHSAFLLDPEQFDAERAVPLPRMVSVGLRGCLWHGIAFDDYQVPESALLGPAGSGIETALRSFHLSRTMVSASALAAVDTSLRTAVQFDRERRGDSWSSSWRDPGPSDRGVTGAFVNLLLYDSLALVATRALHLLPAQTSVLSAALKYLLPRVLIETLYDISSVLGSAIYTREGDQGIFQKHLRDLPVLSLGHAGTVACQATVIPQLSRLARTSWFAGPEAPAELFRLGGRLAPVEPGLLSIACDHDSLSASLVAGAESIRGGGQVERALRALARQLVAELGDLRDRVLALDASGRLRESDAASFALVDRYALLLAGAAVLGVWRHAEGGPDPFLADPCWAAAALHRLAGRLGAAGADLPAECGSRLRDEVQLRFADQRSYDLYSSPVHSARAG